MLRTLPACFAKKRLMDQLGRAGSSIGANFAESSAAESADDFIHKIWLTLKTHAKYQNPAGFKQVAAEFERSNYAMSVDLRERMCRSIFVS